MNRNKCGTYKLKTSSIGKYNEFKAYFNTAVIFLFIKHNG